MANFHILAIAQANSKINNLKLINREILEVFVYGGLAHANAKKKATYDSWEANGLIFPILEFHFCSILEFVLRIINNVFIINKEAINELEKQGLEKAKLFSNPKKQSE